MNNEFNTQENLSNNNELPSELYEWDVIDWLDDEVDPYQFHWDKEFLKFIESSWFDKAYYISDYQFNISKYKDIKSVYDLLSRYQNAAWFEKLQLVIFRKWKDKYLSKEEADGLISDYADDYILLTKDVRNEVINALKDSQDVTNLWDEKLKEKLIETLSKEPTYWRILSNWWKYKYLIWWWRWSKAETWKYYINLMKENWINMTEIK